ncbi:MAG TPA: phosphoribosyltransferase family protein [Hyphomicrobiales bacterium]|nr:phosphoribosyltransferase family protein [Hyphomicrobiales bacterium]
MSPDDPIFVNRRDAGRRLAAVLLKRGYRDPLVLALPRGGVPVAFEIAEALIAPLDVLFVSKIGMPGHEELALGAVVDGTDPQIVLNKEIMAEAEINAGYVTGAAGLKLKEIRRRRLLYRRNNAAFSIAGRTAIVVDDGIATGATVRAALRGARRQRPECLAVAIPVAPADSLDDLAGECDEVICLAIPERFYSVGTYYEDFAPVPDEEVIQLLHRAQLHLRKEPVF